MSDVRGDWEVARKLIALGNKQANVFQVASFVDFTTSEPPFVDQIIYINTLTGTSSITGISVTENYMYRERDGDWGEFVPEEGWIIHDASTDCLFAFDGTTWQKQSTLTEINVSCYDDVSASPPEGLVLTTSTDVTRLDGTVAFTHGLGTNSAIGINVVGDEVLILNQSDGWELRQLSTGNLITNQATDPIIAPREVVYDSTNSRWITLGDAQIREFFPATNTQNLLGSPGVFGAVPVGTALIGNSIYNIQSNGDIGVTDITAITSWVTVGNTGLVDAIRGASNSPDGLSIWVMTDSEIYSIDPNTATSTLVGSHSFTGGEISFVATGGGDLVSGDNYNVYTYEDTSQRAFLSVAPFTEFDISSGIPANWVICSTSGASHPDDDVESVTGTAVDNTDPRNPVIVIDNPWDDVFTGNSAYDVSTYTGTKEKLVIYNDSSTAQTISGFASSPVLLQGGQSLITHFNDGDWWANEESGSVVSSDLISTEAGNLLILGDDNDLYSMPEVFRECSIYTATSNPNPNLIQNQNADRVEALTSDLSFDITPNARNILLTQILVQIFGGSPVTPYAEWVPVITGAGVSAAGVMNPITSGNLSWVFPNVELIDGVTYTVMFPGSTGGELRVDTTPVNGEISNVTQLAVGETFTGIISGFEYTGPYTELVYSDGETTKTVYSENSTMSVSESAPSGFKMEISCLSDADKAEIARTQWIKEECYLEPSGQFDFSGDPVVESNGDMLQSSGASAPATALLRIANSGTEPIQVNSVRVRAGADGFTGTGTMVLNGETYTLTGSEDISGIYRTLVFEPVTNPIVIAPGGSASSSGNWGAMTGGFQGPVASGPGSNPPFGGGTQARAEIDFTVGVALPETEVIVRTNDDGSLFIVDREADTLTPLVSIPAEYTQKAPTFSAPDSSGKVAIFDGDIDVDGTIDPDGMLFDDKGRYTDVATANIYFSGKGYDFEKVIWINPENGCFYRGSGKVTDDAPEVIEVLEQVLSTGGTFADNNVEWRVRVDSAALTPVTGGEVRFALQGASGTTLNIDGVFVGLGDAVTDTSFQASPTPLTFGGNSNVTLVDNNIVYSDPIAMDIPTGEDVLLSLFYSSPGATINLSEATDANYTSFFRSAGANLADADNIAMSLPNTQASTLRFLAGIESVVPKSGGGIAVENLDASIAAVNYDLGPSIGATPVILNLVDVTNGGSITSTDLIEGSTDLSNYNHSTEILAVPSTVREGGPTSATQPDGAPNSVTWVIVPGVVELRRGNNGGLYNIIGESGWSSATSPADTEWRNDTVATYTNFAGSYNNAIGDNILSPAYGNVVMRIISTGVEVPITFTAWQIGGGGGFSAVGDVPETVTSNGWHLVPINQKAQSFSEDRSGSSMASITTPSLPSSRLVWVEGDYVSVLAQDGIVEFYRNSTGGFVRREIKRTLNFLDHDDAGDPRFDFADGDFAAYDSNLELWVPGRGNGNIYKRAVVDVLDTDMSIWARSGTVNITPTGTLAPNGAEFFDFQSPDEGLIGRLVDINPQPPEFPEGLRQGLEYRFLMYVEKAASDIGRFTVSTKSDGAETATTSPINIYAIDPFTGSLEAEFENGAQSQIGIIDANTNLALSGRDSVGAMFDDGAYWRLEILHNRLNGAIQQAIQIRGQDYDNNGGATITTANTNTLRISAPRLNYKYEVMSASTDQNNISVQNDYEHIVDGSMGSLSLDLNNFREYFKTELTANATLAIPSSTVGSISKFRVVGNGNMLSFPSTSIILRGEFDANRENHIEVESVSNDIQLVKIYSLDVNIEQLIFRHDINGGLFTSRAQAESINSTSANPETEQMFSIFGTLENFRRNDGTFRFRLVYPSLGEEIVWEQTSNPVTDAANNVNSLVVSDYNLLSSTSTNVLGTGVSSFSGLSTDSNHTGTGSPGAPYSGNSNSNWWYPIGQSLVFTGGIPAYNAGSVVTTDIIELYVIRN